MRSAVRFTVTDLEGLPDRLDDTRYELIDGELLVSTQPRLEHQFATAQVLAALVQWSAQSGLGLAYLGPGVIFSPEDAVAPDVIWISHERAAQGTRSDGHLYVAPELMIEVLSPGAANARRDRELKLKLYGREGVDEYWLLDWQARTVDVYRRAEGELQLVVSLADADELRSPLLPSFAFEVRRLWSVGFGAE